MAKPKTIVVKAICPLVPYEDLARFIIDALETWGGQRRPPGALSDDDPGDPLFSSLDVKSVKIGSQTFKLEDKSDG